jgi:hypothetical protein
MACAPGWPCWRRFLFSECNGRSQTRWLWKLPVQSRRRIPTSRKWGASTVVHFSRYLWRQAMKASLLYRIAAVLLLFFAVGHTLGFRQSDPDWGVDTLLGSMRSIHFDVQGFSRTYWDLFVAAGLSVGVFYLFAAILAWQLGSLPAETLALMRGTAWAFAVCFAAITVVSWRYLFILPIVFSMVITVCLIAAAWLSAQPI